MIAQQDIEEVLNRHFPFLREPKLREEIITNGSLKKVPAGEALMEIGGYIKYMPLVVSGTIKIVREDEEGREILLYYLKNGNTCAMSLTCCMSSKRSEIRAVTEEETLLLMLPVHLMDQFMISYPSWKEFVMGTYQQRFEEMLHTIDSIAFKKMDERLLTYLHNKCESLNTKELHTTHQQIALDLNSTREVVSRLLKQLEREGVVTLGRNKVTVLA